jgi:hypothetical protein
MWGIDVHIFLMKGIVVYVSSWDLGRGRED